ncbi:hypothetical protein NUW54_g12950 [Trametes sanguinea]|uniref:Uncharacterized protein n=1 Tax=Trametes sanguinea TaxID=158606 RepID=A0ACC1MS63_9APHY|nr:hypothetical protein NUW54_g12950 [Trametes sanguinea]
MPPQAFMGGLLATIGSSTVRTLSTQRHYCAALNADLQTVPVNCADAEADPQNDVHSMTTEAKMSLPEQSQRSAGFAQGEAPWFENLAPAKKVLVERTHLQVHATCYSRMAETHAPHLAAHNLHDGVRSALSHASPTTWYMV